MLSIIAGYIQYNECGFHWRFHKVRSLGKNFETKMFKFRIFYAPPNKTSYTTPHYYPKYENQAIENFLVEDPFKMKMLKFQICSLGGPTIYIIHYFTLMSSEIHYLQIFGKMESQTLMHLMKHCFLPKKACLPKSAEIMTNLKVATYQRLLGLKIFVRIHTFRRRPIAWCNSCYPALEKAAIGGWRTC